jgi:membrane-bound metal-dependent hydrolase YbcI (DUF457 family)
MALAVTHIILTIILLDVFRHYVFGKKLFPRYLLVIGGIAGLFPDIDILFTWIYNFIYGTTASLHGTFTHSLLFPLIFLVIGIILHYKKETKWTKIFYVIAAGLFFHLFLDCLFFDYGIIKSFFWPFSEINFCPRWGINKYGASIDAIILVVWLIHEEIHKKIKDYI